MARQRPTLEIDRIVIRDAILCGCELCGQGAPGLVMGPCIVGIDRIVIREVQYQFEVNRCRNEEIIVKGNFGWVWFMWAGPQVVQRGAPGLVMGPCIVEIDRIVIREVQYQFEVNPRRNEEIIVKGNLRWVWPVWAERPRIDRLYQFEVNRCRNEEINANAYPHTEWLVMGPCIVEIDRIVIREVQYQLEVNWCRNEQVIEKAILGGCDLCGQGAPGLVIGPCIVEIDCIVIREVQNEEIIVKGNFGWVWSMWAGRPRIDRIVGREVQYQFEVNPCRNEEIIVKGNCGLVWPMWAGRPRIDRIVIREVQYQFEVNRCRNEEVNFQGSSANSVGGDSGQDGRTDRQAGQPDRRTAEITTISPPFFLEEKVARTDRRTDGRTAEITTISTPFCQKACG
ncbi:hypothetical protein DPMN_155380 [Dreissena polymorpha]|uniref:Uncharacterized protein n=1 Tax=Dreissena polymorpha TaxID=45954 RepID=A0A9D4FQ89_DREPO|nr:hypothetical protein DPMN_155380 [Dreissena polymorpha]